VRGDRDRLRADRLRDRLERLDLARRDDDGGPVLGELAGDRLADPAARAGDDRDLAFEVDGAHRGLDSTAPAGAGTLRALP
jgi:hypothetical protein